MLFNKEPTAILGAISEVLRQAIPMMVIFGLFKWTAEQLAAVMAVYSPLLALVTILLQRSQTVPAEKANSQIATALLMPATATVQDVVKKEEKESAL